MVLRLISLPWSNLTLCLSLIIELKIIGIEIGYLYELTLAGYGQTHKGKYLRWVRNGDLFMTGDTKSDTRTMPWTTYRTTTRTTESLWVVSRVSPSQTSYIKLSLGEDPHKCGNSYHALESCLSLLCIYKSFILQYICVEVCISLSQVEMMNNCSVLYFTCP